MTFASLAKAEMTMCEKKEAVLLLNDVESCNFVMRNMKKTAFTYN